MPIARRSFLKSATTTTIAAGLALSSAHLIFGQQPRKGAETADFPVPVEAQKEESFQFRSSTFKPYVGDIFQIPNARGEMITLRLVSVSDYKAKGTTKLATRRARDTESFSLTFSATQKLPPFTSIHKMSHPALGEFDLFLTSRKSDDGDHIYEAVFNRMQ
jgi:hypothetical protein